ncbi:MAG: dihydroorotate dehydrogenase [Ardenticatenaceae bacterium]|nr:dihydroorotate dehydrogenase [Ardenticatenaceae bacterium]
MTEQLRTRLGTATLPNPLVLASGIIGTSATLLRRAAEGGAGAVTAKSVGPLPRVGHRNPICFDWGGGIINAVGLPGPGAAAEVEVLCAAKAALAPMGVPLFASIFAGTPDEFAGVAATILEAAPDLLELNLSCPNVHDDLGEPFATSCPAAASVTAAVAPVCRAAGVPLFVKLAPNVPNIGAIAEAVVAAGADGITAINTMPGMIIDIESGAPVLTNRSGGVSGPALKPIAIRAVYEIAAAVPGVPIIGTGGVTAGADAIEMLMAGATAVGVGSAVWYRGVDAFAQINAEIAAWLNDHGTTLGEIRGLVHHARKGLQPS